MLTDVKDNSVAFIPSGKWEKTFERVLPALSPTVTMASGGDTNMQVPACSQPVPGPESALISEKPAISWTITPGQKRSRTKSVDGIGGKNRKFLKAATEKADGAHRENEGPQCQLFNRPATNTKSSPGRLNLVSLQSEMHKIELSIDEKFRTFKDDLKSTISDVIADTVKCEMLKLETRFQSQMSSLKKRVDTLETEKDKMQSQINNVTCVVTSLQSSDTNSNPIIDELESKSNKILETVQKHQKFLETLDSERRASNIIITGVKENDPDDRTTAMSYLDQEAVTDKEKTDLILHVIGASDVKIHSIQRLGVLQTGPQQKPRPIKLVLEKSTDRHKVLAEAKKLKTAGPSFSSVYMNKDMHPNARKEMGRIRKVLKDEKSKPANHGRNVTYDHKSRCVMIDDVIVDKYNPSFL